MAMYHPDPYQDHQLSLRKREMMEMARRGYRVPIVTPLEVMSYGDSALSQAPIMDELRYNHNSMTYETSSQNRKIQELELELAQKKLTQRSEENQENVKLENLIAYYYNR